MEIEFDRYLIYEGSNFPYFAVDRYTKEIFERPWPGRSGSTKKSVYLSLCSYTFKRKHVIVHASVRKLAIDAAIGLDTASRALHGLTIQGLIQRKRHHTRQNPSSLGDEFLLVDLIDYLSSQPPEQLISRDSLDRVFGK